MSYRFSWADSSKRASRAAWSTTSNSLQGPVTLPNFVHLVSELAVTANEFPRQTQVELDALVGMYQKVGEGGQFQVFRPEPEIGGPVVKRVQLHTIARNDSDQLRSLELEIRALSDDRVRKHPNIVDLMGWGYDTVHESSAQSDELLKQLVFPIFVPILYVEPAMTSLDQFLETDLPWYQRLNLCMDVAAGLECLHTCGILHNDLKPENILICRRDVGNRRYVAKLADFGFALHLCEEGVAVAFSDYGRTYAWKPPESKDYSSEKHGDISTEGLLGSESYAFGLLSLNVLFSRGSDEIRNPFSLDQLHRALQLKPCLEYVSETSLEDGACARKVISIIETKLFEESPHERELVSVSLFADLEDATEYWFSWYSMARNEERKPSWRRGWQFYRHLPDDIKQFLVRNNSDGFEGYPGDLLFGLAISQFSTPGVSPNATFLELLRNAVTAAPKSIRAAGIISRVEAALSASYSTSKPTAYKDRLYEAATTGSHLALSDLSLCHPAEAIRAASIFRSTGGYNNDTSTLFDAFNTPLDSVNSLSHATDGIYPLALKSFPLHHAAAIGSCEAINRLVNDCGLHVNERNNEGETPLYKACKSGQAEAVTSLLALGASASVRPSANGPTPLHWLFIFEPTQMDEVARKLLAHGCPLNGRYDTSTLYSGHRSYVYDEMTHFPFHWPQGTPVHWAAHMENEDAVDTLLRHGAFIDELNGQDDRLAQTALSMAMYHGSSTMVSHLLEKGADPFFMDKSGRTPLHLLAWDDGAMRSLFPLPKRLRQWCIHGSFESSLNTTRSCIRAMTAKGVSLEVVRREGSTMATPLLYAAQSADASAVIALLEAGADPAQTRDWSGKGPLQLWLQLDPESLAYPEAYFEVLNMLLERTEVPPPKLGETLELVNHSSLQAFNMTIWKQKLDVLLSSPHHQFNLEARGERGQTMLLSTMNLNRSGLNHLAVLEHLLGLGVDLTARDDDGKDILFHIATATHISDDVCFLVMKEYLNHFPENDRAEVVNKSRSIRTGNTALINLADSACFRCVTLAIDIGADVNMSSWDGLTALDWAIETGNRFRLALSHQYFEIYGHVPVASSGIEDKVFARGTGRSVFASQGSIQTPEYMKRMYFGLADIISALVAAGGKTGKQLGLRSSCPDVRVREAGLLERLGDQDYDITMQPYYERWKVVYAFDDATEEDYLQTIDNQNWPPSRKKPTKASVAIKHMMQHNRPEEVP